MQRLPSTAALQMFVEAAHAESFVRAADALNITQAAVSKQIKNLEEIIGAPLFERRHRQVLLTDRGAAYLPVAEGILRDLAIATEQAGTQPTYAELSIEIDHELLTYWMLPRMQNLRAHFPDCHFQFNAPQMNARRPNRYTDLAIVYGRPTFPGLTVEAFLDYVAFPVCAPSLVNGPSRNPAWEDLKERTLLHDYSKSWWDETLKRLGISVKPSDPEILLGQATACLTAAAQGIGIAIGDDVTCRQMLDDGTLVRVTDVILPGRESHYIVTQQDSPTSSLADAFIDWLRREEAAHFSWRRANLGRMTRAPPRVSFPPFPRPLWQARWRFPRPLRACARG